MKLTLIDICVIVGYLGALWSIGLYVAFRHRRHDEGFLVDRRFGWFNIGSSIFATNIGPTFLIGTASAAYADGHGHCQLRVAGVDFPVPAGRGLRAALHSHAHFHHAGVHPPPFRRPPRPISSPTTAWPPSSCSGWAEICSSAAGCCTSCSAIRNGRA